MRKTRIASIFLLLMGVSINTLAIEPEYNPDSKILKIPAVKVGNEFLYGAELQLNGAAGNVDLSNVDLIDAPEEAAANEKKCKKDQITVEIFNQIDDKMLLDEINSLIGCKGQSITVDDSIGELYVWTESLLPQIQITFQNNTIVNKTYQSLGERAIDPEFDPNTLILKIPTIKTPDPAPGLVDPGLDSFIHFYDAMLKANDATATKLEILAYAENPPKKCEIGRIKEENFNKIEIKENVEINENNKMTLDRVNSIIGCTGVIVDDHYLWKEEEEEEETETETETMWSIEAAFKDNVIVFDTKKLIPTP